jgi:hypothetical protein
MTINQRHSHALYGNETNRYDAMMEGIASTGAGIKQWQQLLQYRLLE